MDNEEESLRDKKREEWIESQWKIVESIYHQAYVGFEKRADISDSLHHRRVSDYINMERTEMADVLRDVLEDTDWTIEKIAAEGICPKVIEALRYLVREPDEPYMEYVKRVTQNDIAALVTLGYIQEGLEIKRFKCLTNYDFKYLNMLLEAYHYLEDLELQKYENGHYEDLFKEF